MRTNRQNNALHLYFEQVAEKMSDAGYTCRAVLEVAPELQITPSFVKRLWQEFQLKVLGTRHTRNLVKTKEIDKVYDEFNLWLGEKLKIESIPFPSSLACKDGKQFHITEEGKPAYSERYDEVGDFSEGRARVRKDGKRFRITADGKKVD